MKIKSVLIIILALTISTSKLFAQQQQRPTLVTDVTVTKAGNVKEHEIRSFNRSFKNALDPTWPALNAKYMVHFISSMQENGVQPQQPKQRPTYRVTYVNVNDVPSFITIAIIDKYSGYHISGAIKIEGNGKSIWMAEAKNDEKLMVVSIEDNNIKELGNYYRFM